MNHSALHDCSRRLECLSVSWFATQPTGGYLTGVTLDVRTVIAEHRKHTASRSRTVAYHKHGVLRATSIPKPNTCDWRVSGLRTLETKRNAKKVT